jgi:hypothetical protein
MQKNKKFIAGIVCVILAVAALIGSFAFVDWYQNRSVFTDKNGWIHNIEGTEYESDPYASLNYVVIDSDKTEFENMTAHQFLSKLKPIFKAYSGKAYITFSFGDGTGLYWPYANKKYDGIYGMIDDFGTITSQKSFIHIEGNTVTSEETSSETSEDSVNMFALLPEAYYSDNTMVSVMEDVLYLNVYFDASTRSYEEIANELWDIYKSADLSGINTILIRMNDDVFYEVNTRVDNSTPVFVEDGYQKWAVFLYGDEASTNTNDVIEETEYDPSMDPALSGIYEETESTEE